MFIKTFTSRDTGELSESQQTASEWYAGFIEHRVRQSWLRLLHPILVGIDSTITDPSQTDIDVAFKLLTKVVAFFIADRRSIALIDIVNDLQFQEEALLKDLDDDRSLAMQLTFAILGWTSEYYVSNSLFFLNEELNPVRHALCPESSSGF